MRNDFASRKRPPTRSEIRSTPSRFKPKLPGSGSGQSVSARDWGRRRFVGRSPRWLALAREVIQRSGRDSPADRVLRDVLREARDLTGGERGETAQAVFRYYRWLGWLEGEGGLTKRIQKARELAERAEPASGGFSEPELLQRAVPAWVWQEMVADAAWCRSLQRPPVLWLRARPGQREGLAKELGRCTPGPSGLADALRYDGTEDVFSSRAFTEGRVEIQDLSSQAVGLMCGVKPGQHWWDVCAGEGGKAVHLAALMGGKGVVWATDRSAWRLSRFKRRAARAGVFNYQAFRWNLGEPLPFSAELDGALVDAPCSGLGTWQRNPHARWTVQPGDVEELAKVQLEVLTAAAEKVKRGGRLIYSVCTMTRRETSEVVRAFERVRTDYEPLDVAHPLEPARTGSRHWIKAWDLGASGMYVAAWRRSR